MVFNTARIVQLPFGCGQMHAHTKIMRGKGLGSGMGSVLLRKGGAGSASSYMDIDDYVATTGINPYTRSKSSGAGVARGALTSFDRPMGRGFGIESQNPMERMREKLSKLSVEQPSTTKPKIRKIQMSM
jgi:L-aminopeptidase/D-esterase-like protein